MAVSKQNVLEGIMAASQQESSSPNTVQENVELSIEETIDDDTGSIIKTPSFQKHSTISTIIEESSESSRDSFENCIPEESEIASNMGEIACEFTEEDIGKRVLVEGYDSIGTLRFCGHHATKAGMRCGIELDNPVGRNNGTVAGNIYFECEDKKGVLVAPYKVKLLSADSDSD